MASMNGYPVRACKIIYHVKTQNVFVDEMRRSAYIQMIYNFIIMTIIIMIIIIIIIITVLVSMHLAEHSGFTNNYY